MYFKAVFSDPIQENHPLLDQISVSNLTGNETITFNNYEFEVERNTESEIVGLTFCNQCVNTYGIETEFIKLILELLTSESPIKLYDSNGLTELFYKEDLEEYIN